MRLSRVVLIVAAACLLTAVAGATRNGERAGLERTPRNLDSAVLVR